jgi:CHAT domain-containing protein/tetratricopeptide (TPR) repeat protein
MAVMTVSCGRSPSPEDEYQEIRLKAQRGEYDAALADTKKAVSKYARGNREWNLRFKELEAHILVAKARLDEALKILNEALPPDLASSDIAVRQKIDLGLAYFYSQQLPLAEKYLGEAHHLAEEHQPSLLGEVDQARGTVQVAQGNYAEAEATFKRVLDFSHRRGEAYLEAVALGSLGNQAMGEEHYDRAIGFYERALKLFQDLHIKSYTARTLGNMGWNYFQLGDFDSALDHFKQAADASLASNLTADQAYWMAGIADSYFANGAYPDAKEILSKAVDLASPSQDKDTLIECLNDLSAVELQTSDLAAAEMHNQRALDLTSADQSHSEFLSAQIVRSQILLANRKFDEAQRLLESVAEDPAADSPTRWEAQARMAKVFEEEAQWGKAEEQYRQAISTFQKVRDSVSEDELRLSFLSSAMSFLGDYIDFLIVRNRPNDALHWAEFSRARTLAEGLLGAGPNPSAVIPSNQTPLLARRLDATLLFYWLGEKHSYLWAITPAGIATFPLPPIGQIKPLVKSYREAQATGRDIMATAREDGEKLYQILVAPAQKLIRKGSRAFVLPDASLFSLNFETLIVPDPQPHFWIEDVTVTTANSLTLLGSVAARRASKAKKLLLVGDTVQAKPEFPVLGQAPQEISMLEKYFPESERTLLVKDKATPTAYLASNPGNYAYLHFVTHGTASRTRPLESAVILSPEGDSYKLYARDIVQRRLNAQLVTISACNGSGARAYSGEGLVGLSWAFLRAGAHNVIGALWEVSDTSTPQLMDTLYNGLSRGQDPATALRSAKLSLLHSDSPYKKPYYWAPFQLYSGS